MIDHYYDYRLNLGILNRLTTIESIWFGVKIDKIMGVILFTVVAIGSIYWLMGFFRSFSQDLPRRREAFTLDYPRAGMPVEPVITPVDEREVKPMPARLPEVVLDYAPIVPPIPVVDRSVPVLPNFTPIPTKKIGRAHV